MAERLLLASVLLLAIAIIAVLVRYLLAHRAATVAGSFIADLLPELGQQPAVLYLSTPSCATCRTAQAPALARVQAHLGPALRVIAVNALERPDIVARLGVMAVPATAVLDGSGRVHRVNYGYADAETLQRQIEPLLGDATPELVPSE
jgi:thioredoxin-like negative regulator of GroEL